MRNTVARTSSSRWAAIIGASALYHRFTWLPGTRLWLRRLDRTRARRRSLLPGRRRRLRSAQARPWSARLRLPRAVPRVRPRRGRGSTAPWRLSWGPKVWEQGPVLSATLLTQRAALSSRLVLTSVASEGKCEMRAITIEAKSVGSARRLYNALIEFHPELAGSEDDGYRVSVELGSSESRLIDVLTAIEQYVTEANSGPARIDVDGRRYTLHAVT